MAEDPTVMGRIAERAADIPTEFQPREPCRQGGGRTAGRAARDAGQIPGVIGGPVDVIEALPVGQHQGDVGLPEDNGAGGLQPLHGHRVALRIVVLIRRIPPRRGRADPVEALFNRHGHAMQRSPDFPACECGIRSVCALAGLLVLPENNGIEPGIVVLHALQIELQQLPCADVLAPDLVASESAGAKARCSMTSPRCIAAAERQPQPLPEAGARHERTLEAVACTRLFGVV